MSVLTAAAAAFGFATGSRPGALVAGILASIAAVIAFWRAMPRSRKKFPPPSDSANAPASSSQLSGRLLTIQEEERKSLSRDLHDGIGQILTALKMELSRVKAAGADDADRLARARSMTDDMLASIRNISRLLRPVALDDLGLEAALHAHVEEFSRRSSIDCELTCSLPGDQSLPDSVKTCVFRVIQEALNNCEKHASPVRVHVNVEQDDKMIRVRVADDGAGFQHPVSEIQGMGLEGMWERAAILGGRVEIESAPGRGTTVILTLPIALVRQPAVPADEDRRL